MSLLNCLCCPRHDYRTAVITDDLKLSSVETYGNVMRRARRLSCYMRQNYDNIGESATKQDRVVALWSDSCPEALSGILGILGIPAAYMPMSVGETPLVSPGGVDAESETECRLRSYDVRLALIHHSCLQSLVSERWSGVCVTIDTSILEFGFVCAIFSSSSLLTTTTLPSAPSPTLSPSPSSHCISTDMCGTYSSRTISSLSECASFLSGVMDTYFNDIHDIMQCRVCSAQHCSEVTKNNTKCSIDSPCADDVSRNVTFGSETEKSDVRSWRLPTLSPMSLAYVIHTSGTTGRPKPVHVPHCCIVPNIIDLTQRFSICPDDCVFNAAPLTFDPSVVEIFLALYNGASLLCVPSHIRRSPTELANVLFTRNRATVLQITPSLFRRLPEVVVAARLLGDRSCVRILAFGGERCPSLRLLAKYKSLMNSTSIFNIYGTTEVSSWSTCHAVSDAALERARERGERERGAGSEEGEGDRDEDGREGEVPLGEAMLGTRVEVRDHKQRRVCDGHGDIYLGGEYRVCILDNDSSDGDGVTPSPSLLRSTGDSGWVDSKGCIYFAGRHDRQMKRWGHRISLDYIEQCVAACESVSACAVVATGKNHSTDRRQPLGAEKVESSDSECKVVAFVVPRPSSVPHKWRERLLQELVWCLPGHCVPDTIVPVHHLPCNKHGKVDTNRLLQFDNDPALYLSPTLPRDTTHLTADTMSDVAAVKQQLLSVLKRLTRFSNWPADLTLLELGCTSFDVVRVAAAMETDFSCHAPSLTHVLLTRRFRDVVNYLWAELNSDEEAACGDERGEVVSLSRKRVRDELDEEHSSKRLPQSASNPIIARRRGETFCNGKLCVSKFHVEPKSASFLVQMSVKWSYNTGRCVDASPLVTRVGQAPPTLFIGSHSGVFVCLCVKSGKLLWRNQLSDRIEASACLSLCGKYVVVGCYDGTIYIQRSDNGIIHWTLKLSSEPVKSSACVDSTTGLVWVGSHDRHLYSIDVEAGNVVHKVFLGGGSCFSSPCVDSHRGVVYATTLCGAVTAVDKGSGTVLWTFSCGGKPVFSSPTLLPSGDVAIGCVDCCVYIIGSDGKKGRQLKTGHPVFSTCTVAELGAGPGVACDSIVIPSHSMCLGEDNACVVEEEGASVLEGVMDEEEVGVVEDVTERKSCVEGGERREGVSVVEGGMEEEVRVERDLTEGSSVRVFCGSHDKCVYCWDGHAGKQLWKTPLHSEVYSTPSPCHLSSDTVGVATTSLPNAACVCACSTSGHVYLLDIRTGHILETLKLPGEVFSSPAVVDNHILVGCRDDYIYCIKCLLK